jgi:DNA polymerase-1
MPIWYFGDGNGRDVLIDILQHPPEAIAWDTETNTLEDKRILCFAWSDRPDRSFVIVPEGDHLPRDVEFMVPLVSNPHIVKVGQNWMFDLVCLPNILGPAFDRSNLFDTNVAARILGYEETSLNIIASEYGFYTKPADQIMAEHKTKTFDKVPIEEVVEHCNFDVRATIGLYTPYKERILKAVSKEYWDVEMKVMPMAQDVAGVGIKIDHTERKRLLKIARTNLEFYDRMVRCTSLGKISNPGSPMQVAKVLIDRGNYLPVNDTQTAVTTNEEALEKLIDPLASMVLLYRGQEKVISTYLDPEKVPIKDLARYPNEYTMDTGVGRFSSRRHNVQNIPGKDAKLNLRSFLVPDSDTWTMADFKQEHFYILANTTKDPELLKAMYTPGSDIHKTTASLLFNCTIDAVTAEQRRLAKTVGYAMIYGGTPETLQSQAKIPDISLCRSLVDRYFTAYPVTARWMKYAVQVGKETGWSLPTVFNRRIKLPTRPMGELERKAVNYPILGSDGEIFKRGMLSLAGRGLGPPIMRILVHDEFVFDGKLVDKFDDLAHIAPFEIPVDVEYCERWK